MNIPADRSRPAREILECSAALCLAATLLCACGGSTTTAGNSCGPGTKSVSGECVVTSDEAGAGATGDAMPDSATQGDARTESGATLDAGTSPATDADGSTSGPTSDAAASDPCVDAAYGVFVSCDPACPRGASPQTCMTAQCGQGQAVLQDTMSGPIAQAVIRTPQLSGVDAGCAPQCADSGAPFVYELEFDFQGSPATPYNISVAPPWEIIPFPEFVAPPICSGSPKSCWHFAGDSNLNLYIATTDPNAPARNVYIEPASACF